jgi:hypothetical protein
MAQKARFFTFISSCVIGQMNSCGTALPPAGPALPPPPPAAAAAAAPFEEEPPPLAERERYSYIVRIILTRGPFAMPARKRGSFFEFSLCLSRACLDKNDRF